MYTPLFKECYSSCKECESGSWRVILGSANPRIDCRYWYIRNTTTGTIKRVDKVQLKGKNWYDEAHKEAHKRNGI